MHATCGQAIDAMVKTRRFRNLIFFGEQSVSCVGTFACIHICKFPLQNSKYQVLQYTKAKYHVQSSCVHMWKQTVLLGLFFARGRSQFQFDFCVFQLVLSQIWGAKELSKKMWKRFSKSQLPTWARGRGPEFLFWCFTVNICKPSMGARASETQSRDK